MAREGFGVYLGNLQLEAVTAIMLPSTLAIKLEDAVAGITYYFKFCRTQDIIRRVKIGCC